jgi:hypothetical protein
MVTKEQLAVLSRKLSDLRQATALISLEIAIKKFDPNQLRWDRGTSWGGRFRDPDDPSTPPPPAAQLATFTLEGVWDDSRGPGCLKQRDLDEAICARFTGRRCWDRSFERYINCMKNVYIPPLMERP